MRTSETAMLIMPSLGTSKLAAAPFTVFEYLKLVIVRAGLVVSSSVLSMRVALTKASLERAAVICAKVLRSELAACGLMLVIVLVWVSSVKWSLVVITREVSIA